jgi:hypothetical protein
VSNFVGFIVGEKIKTLVLDALNMIEAERGRCGWKVQNTLHVVYLVLL